MEAITAVMTYLFEHVRNDVPYTKLKQYISEGLVTKYWIEDDLIYTLGERVYVFTLGELQIDLLHQNYDAMWVGHLRVNIMLALLTRSSYLPKMKQDL